MLELPSQEALLALACVPAGEFVLSSSFEGRRAGVLVRWVQVCAGEPPLVSVALKRGHWIDPLIRDARHFAVTRTVPGDRLIHKKFGEGRRDGDPFDCLPVETLRSGAPIIKRGISALDCEVVRHLELDADCSLYIGRVIAGRVYDAAALNRPQDASEQHGAA